jgi:hypothetical protein
MWCFKRLAFSRNSVFANGEYACHCAEFKKKRFAGLLSGLVPLRAGVPDRLIRLMIAGLAASVEAIFNRGAGQFVTLASYSSPTGHLYAVPVLWSDGYQSHRLQTQW